MPHLLDWLDHRTGYRGVLHHLLDESLPKGTGWFFTTGSALLFLLGLQALTGVRDGRALEAALRDREDVALREGRPCRTVASWRPRRANSRKMLDGRKGTCGRYEWPWQFLM